jgi:predicted nucleic acid-binding protein
VANRWVVNASPIISLVKIDRIHLLSELCDEVIIVRGTLAIILLAKQMGYIASVKQDFEKLMQVGLRISPTILAQAIALAEEQ